MKDLRKIVILFLVIFLIGIVVSIVKVNTTFKKPHELEEAHIEILKKHHLSL